MTEGEARRQAGFRAWLRPAVVLAATALALAALWWLTRDGGSGSPGQEPLGVLEEGSPLVGQRAPDFALLDPQGEPVRLSDLRGRPVVINFWATWCEPCREEMPALQRLYAERDGGVAVVAVNFRETPDAAAAFVRELGLTFPVALDRQGEVAARYGVRGLPSSFFVDGGGVVRAVHFGPLDEQSLRQRLAETEAGDPN